MYVRADLQKNKNSDIFAAGIEIWCNGSTRDFGSLCPGSNPGISTKAMSQPSGWLFECI